MKKIVKSFYLHARQAVLHGGGSDLAAGSSSGPCPIQSKIRNILFIRTDRIGDMVLSTAALRAIKTRISTCALDSAGQPIQCAASAT